MTWSTDVLVAATAVVAGFMKITFGVGAGAMITPFLVLAAGPQFALAVLALILPCGDLLAIRTYWGNWDRAQAFALIPATLLGVALALLYLSRAHSSSLGKTIGVITLLLVAFRLWLRSRHGSLGVILFPLWGRAALGIVGGIVSILAGGGVAFYSLYLDRTCDARRRLDRPPRQHADERGSIRHMDHGDHLPEWSGPHRALTTFRALSIMGAFRQARWGIV